MISIFRHSSSPAMPQPAGTGVQNVSQTQTPSTTASWVDGKTGPLPTEVGQRFDLSSAANPLKPHLPVPSIKPGSLVGSVPSRFKLPDVLTTVGIILFGDLKDLIPKTAGTAPAAPQSGAVPTQAQMTDALTKLAFLLKH